MNMKISDLINEIITEWSYRVENGMPDATNPAHLVHLGIVLKEMGLSHIKSALVENLLMEKGKTPEPVKEEEGSFSNPILNKKIKYKNTKGEDKEGFVGNLLRLPAEHPGRKAAEALLPADGSDERDAINKDLGGQGQAAKPEDGKDKEGGEAGGGEEEKAKAAQAMFDPKNDPAMAARMDKEKEVQAQLAKDAEADKAAEKEQEPKEDDGFNPIDVKDVAKEMPQADPETFNGDSDIPDGVTPEQLEQFNTDIAKVAQQVADAKAKGEPAPNINLCDVTVPGTNLYCDDNLGIPRDEMPQFKGTAQPGSRAAGMEVDESGEVDTEPVFKEMLVQKGIKTLQTQIPADKLKATQKDLVGAKVVGMMGALEKDPNHPKITAPIYVSRDGHVIDGHHRWAAIVAYNAAHPDSPIPMKTTVLDMDIKDAIPMANKFAEDMGIAAKKADANKEDVPSEPTQREPANDDPESKAQQFKGKSSGENIQTMEMEGGGFVYGTKHGNTAMVDDILDDVKSKIPKERWKDVVFVGEGGATNDDTGEIEFNDEMKYAAPKFKEFGAEIDTWDGDDMDVHNSESKLYQKQKEKTGLNDNQILAGNWASMIGQGEGQGLDPNDPDNNMKAEDYLDDEGKQFLQDAAKEAGLPPIENFDNPTGEKPNKENGWKGTGDRGTLYRLSFPGDNDDKETKINDIQVAFNDARDEHLIEKNKELTAQGKIPITIAGESHVDLVDKMTRKGKETPTKKLPEPEKPSEKDGGVVYSLGGGYYSDKPNGPAQYMASESVVEKVLVVDDINFSYLLFEGSVTKKTSKGNDVKLVTIDPKNQDKATAAAAAANPQSTDKNTPSAPQTVTSVPNITNKIKKKIENWSESEKDYFKKGHHKAGSDARRTIAETLKDKAKGTWQAVKDGLKHEVHEFKTAGTAVGKLFSSAGGWNDLSHHEKDALKAVGTKIVTTALFGAAMGGLSYGTAGFAKHVAVEFVPHIIAETFLKGAGRAALFADTEGEAEMDAQFIKFTEVLADGLENMKINTEIMEQMIDSYNEKKENGELDNTQEPNVKAEHLHLVDELMLEMIYGFINEIKPKQFQAISKKSGKVSDFDSEEARDAAVKKGTHTDVDSKDKSDTKPAQKGSMYDDPEYQKRMGAETPPTAKKKRGKKFVATAEDKARLKYRKEELAKIVESGLIPTQKKKLSGAGVFVPTEKQMQSLLEVTKKQIEDPEYRLPLPKYDVSEEDIDVAIDTMKGLLGKEFSSVYNSIKKAGGVDPQLTTREAGNQRVRDIIKKYLETGGRSAITGEFVPFNQMQLDHHVPYSSAAQRVADKKKKGIKTTLLAEQDELDSPENWDLMETPLNQLKNSLEGSALIERINKKLSASPDEKEKKELETKLKNVRRGALLTSLVTSFGNEDYSGINEETLEQFNQDEMNVICKAWNWYHPNTKDADQFREIDPKYDEKLKKRGIDTSVRHPLSITRGAAQQGGARGRGQTKPVGELRKSFLAVVKQAGIKLMTKKDVKNADLALARAVRDVETAEKPYSDRMTQLKQQIKQQTSQSKK
jgi:hypothetical protein